MKNKYIFLLVLGGALFAAFLAVFFWLTTTSTKKGAPVGSQANPLQVASGGFEAPKPKIPNPANVFQQSLGPALAPVIGPLLASISPARDQKTPSANGSESAFVEESKPLANQATTSPTGGSSLTFHPALSEEQIFERLWPQSYRNSLVMLQGLMVKDGFILESEQVLHITSDQQIYPILQKIVDYAELQKWVVPEDAKKLRRGIGELERTIITERNILRASGAMSNAVLPGGQRIDKTPMSKQSFFSAIIDGLKYSLAVNAANAQSSGGGSWVTSPDCYKDLSPNNPVPGVNLWAFCCNCGCKYVYYTCVFVPDCGPNSTYCDVPFGCLNLVCGGWPNAIWDPATGICGCG